MAKKQRGGSSYISIELNVYINKVKSQILQDTELYNKLITFDFIIDNMTIQTEQEYNKITKQLMDTFFKGKDQWLIILKLDEYKKDLEKDSDFNILKISNDQNSEIYKKQLNEVIKTYNKEVNNNEKHRNLISSLKFIIQTRNILDTYILNTRGRYIQPITL